jgi:hypothetical protein
MEARKVTFALDITLEQAKQFDKSNNALLTKIARTAYTEQELNEPNWQNIKTLEHACDTLNNNPHRDPSCTLRLMALTKLEIIRTALNGANTYELLTGDYSIYVPHIIICPDLHTAQKIVDQRNNLVICDDVKYKGKQIYLIGGDYYYFKHGIDDYYRDQGDVFINRSLLACKSPEIAHHMSMYFAKEIFNAAYQI